MRRHNVCSVAGKVVSSCPRNVVKRNINRQQANANELSHPFQCTGWNRNGIGRRRENVGKSVIICCTRFVCCMVRQGGSDAFENMAEFVSCYDHGPLHIIGYLTLVFSSGASYDPGDSVCCAINMHTKARLECEIFAIKSFLKYTTTSKIHKICTKYTTPKTCVANLGKPCVHYTVSGSFLKQANLRERRRRTVVGVVAIVWNKK